MPHRRHFRSNTSWRSPARRQSRRRTLLQQTNAQKIYRRQGEFEPAVRIWTFGSRGRCHRPHGWTTGRVHHLLSDLEYHVFLILDWARNVVDIREQFPLPIMDTLPIARRYHLPHPWDTRRKRYRAVTSDVLYTIKRGGRVSHHVRALKYEDALGSMPQLRTLELEWVYWRSRAVDWKIIADTQIPLDYVDNIAWVHTYRQPESLYPLTLKDVARIQRHLTSALRRSTERCCDVADWCDARLGLREATSLGVLRYLIANRLVAVDMRTRIIPTNALQLLEEPQDDFLL